MSEQGPSESAGVTAGGEHGAGTPTRPIEAEPDAAAADDSPAAPPDLPSWAQWRPHPPPGRDLAPPIATTSPAPRSEGPPSDEPPPAPPAASGPDAPPPASAGLTGSAVPTAPEPADPPWQLTPTPPWPHDDPAAADASALASPPSFAVTPPSPPAPVPPSPELTPSFVDSPLSPELTPPSPPAPAPMPAGPPPTGQMPPPPAMPGPSPAAPVAPPWSLSPPAGATPASSDELAAVGPATVDPHHLGGAASRLGGLARRAGKVPLAVVGALLEHGETVQVAVQGRFRGEPAIAVLAERPEGARVIVANGRQWKPDVVSLAVDARLEVHGWQDDRVAALTFVVGVTREVVERIGDRGLAVEMAQRVRHAAGGPVATTTPPPGGWQPPTSAVPAPPAVPPPPPPSPRSV